MIDNDTPHPRKDWEYGADAPTMAEPGEDSIMRPVVYGRPKGSAPRAHLPVWSGAVLKSPTPAQQAAAWEELAEVAQRYGVAAADVKRARYEAHKARGAAGPGTHRARGAPTPLEPFDFEYRGARVRCFVPVAGASASGPSRYDALEWAYEVEGVEYAANLAVDYSRPRAEEQARVRAHVIHLLGGDPGR